jgi:predicted dinucleotide-utilizing enzyme
MRVDGMVNVSKRLRSRSDAATQYDAIKAANFIDAVLREENTMTEKTVMKWQVRKQSDGTVLFEGESWEEANEVAKLLVRHRGYNHNLLDVVEIPRGATLDNEG